MTIIDLSYEKEGYGNLNYLVMEYLMQFNNVWMSLAKSQQCNFSLRIKFATDHFYSVRLLSFFLYTTVAGETSIAEDCPFEIRLINIHKTSSLK